MTAPVFDPRDREALADPYPAYEVLRRDHPCYPVPGANLWVVSRYDDCVAVLRDHARFSSTGGVGIDWDQKPMMPMYDPPQHTRMRRMVARYFTPRALASVQPSLERTVAATLDRALDAGSVDFARDVAVPISLGAIAALVGIPEERWGDLRRWSLGTVEALPGGLDAEARARLDAQRREFVAYLKELLAERRREGIDRGDIISSLVSAEEAERLEPHELVAFCVLLTVAGFETTANGMSNALLALLGHPDEWAKLRADVGLAASAVEEAMRWDCPVQSFFRNTLVEATVAGTVIPPKAKVMVLFGSANRDERRFEAPAEMRIERSPNDHIGFGAGVHYCLGAPLARLEIRLLLEELVRRRIEVTLEGEPRRSYSMLFRGVSAMPARLEVRGERVSAPSTPRSTR